MNKSFSTSEEYLEAVLQLGEMVYSRKPVAIVQEYFAALVRDEEASELFLPFKELRGALDLESPEAMCVALWLYHDASPFSPLTAAELLEHYRRIGRRSPRQALGRLFVVTVERVLLHPVIADFLLDREPRLPEGVELLFPGEGEIIHAKPLLGEFTALLEQYAEHPFPLVIALCGEPGSGRKFLISQICAWMGAAMLKVDLRKQPPAEESLLAAQLYGAAVCLENAEDAGPVAEIVKGAGFVFLVLDEGEQPPQSADYTVFRREMPPPDKDTQQRLLREALEGVPIEEDTVPDIGPHRLHAGRIQTLAGSLRAEWMATGMPIDRQTFQRVFREYNPLRIAGAEVLQCSGTLRDLVLPEELARQLTELCAFVKARDTVYKSWGFGEKVPWGRGISALFYGAPGTGKTMAAGLLSGEVGLPLLRVDISQLMSKYIGETQKNIGRIFDDAAKSDCILFFDEADAIFTRRTESADAQDKYANAETAYLLQRMEGYDGICILATNLLQNFDEAFRRRISYMLHFPVPDEALRERIWRGIFPEGAPVEALDYPLLAKHLELSGASIKNCAVHAAYLAAMNHTGIGMQYILSGAKNEYAKQGKTLGPQIAQLFSI